MLYHSSHCCFLTSLFILFCLSSLFSLFSISLFFSAFSYSFSLPFSVFFFCCARLRPFYTAYCDKIYHFTFQLLLACCGCHSQIAHWSVCYFATTTTLCWPHHASFPEKSSFVLFSCFSWHSHPHKGWASLLLTSIACI